MKESHNKKGRAIHVGPESCEGDREVALEALTGEDAGRAIEPRNQDKLRGADAVMASGRPHANGSPRRESIRPRAVEEPGHAWKLAARKLGDPVAGCRLARDAGSPHREPLRG